MTSLQHAKMVYVSDIMHINTQMKAENIYMASIYMYKRLQLGLYSSYIGIYADIEACVQSRADIYIYIHLNFGVQHQI